MYSQASFPEQVVFFGPCPLEDIYPMLKDEDVSVIWNLAEELSDVAEKEKRHFEHVIHTKIPDFSIPKSKEEFLSDLESVFDFAVSGRIIFVHCLGGRGRTGMALAALAMYLNGLSAEKALGFAHKNCGGPEMECQKDFIYEISNNLSRRN